MDELSHVDYLAENVQRLIDERFCGKMVGLSRFAHVDKGAIARMRTGKPCRLLTVDRVAQACGLTIGDIFLKPGTQTDWYREAKLCHLSANLEAITQEQGILLDDVADEIGRPHGSLDRYLSGHWFPQTNTLRLMAEALDEEVADLFLPPNGGE